MIPPNGDPTTGDGPAASGWISSFDLNDRSSDPSDELRVGIPFPVSTIPSFAPSPAPSSPSSACTCLKRSALTGRARSSASSLSPSSLSPLCFTSTARESGRGARLLPRCPKMLPGWRRQPQVKGMVAMGVRGILRSRTKVYGNRGSRLLFTLISLDAARMDAAGGVVI